MRSRASVLSTLRASPTVDVLIVGAGINGIGLYRDLAAQGVGALLIDQADFCSGASAAPSRLVHGGLRYLETGEFALVRESVVERNRLLHNAPHLVKPLAVWVPLRQHWAGLLKAPARLLGWTRAPGAKGSLVTKLGLLVYDWFGRGNQATPRHKMIGRKDVQRLMPAMDRSVRMAAQFYDARLSHPERLALELIKDAEADCPAALAISYLSLEGAKDGVITLRDHAGNQTFTVRAKLVVNTAGPWVDRVNDRFGIRSGLIGGTRGSHLVLRHAALATQLAGRMIYFETPDHRICLAYGIGNDNVLLGTTDISTQDPDDNCCTSAEVDYLFDALKSIMPHIDASHEHIVFQYAGIRPLPHADEQVTGSISRDHSVHAYEPDASRPFAVLALVGGKWTTYRACAEQIADTVLLRLQRKRLRSTGALPVGGGADWPYSTEALDARLSTWSRHYGLAGSVVRTLWERYGCACEAVLASVAQYDGAPAPAARGYWKGELLHLIRHGRVMHLDDIVLRRTLLALEGHCTFETLGEIAAWMAGEMNWDAEQTEAEIARTASLLRERHGVKIPGNAAALRTRPTAPLQ
ncbi:glycerol-3-phosphate dehydrogenase/oxidase [Paraburkholderia sp. SUR17]|uniref:glycerol-3-phosphate dehydrogenase/oxidase n=1 Tax=Paraburkholderia sp. SUR17 TaxID=3034358 RepID=UPI0024082980|nr:glycerol-3-phosphate dehydrogenase/oxidase [Paraburkholderia sp. SUR17]WEY37677.1 glycerol-3-phosphate dehydrogenase/oxidase [Paraburkholderia sp. SUR17]